MAVTVVLLVLGLFQVVAVVVQRIKILALVLMVKFA